MTSARPHLSIAPSEPRSAWACGWLLGVRWLLILLLALDQVSVPWHAHVHDADGSLSAVWLDGIEAETTPSLKAASATRHHHGLIALRLSPNPHVLNGRPSHEGSSPDLAPSPWIQSTLIRQPADASGGWAHATQDRRPSHRSLPPNGRAPPRQLA